MLVDGVDLTSECSDERRAFLGNVPPDSFVTDLHAFRIATSLPCRGCRYDLRGLHADGRCPECSLEVLETIADRVDPELALLQPLKHPRLAGGSLLVLAVALSTATIGTSVSAAAIILSRLPRDGWRGVLGQWLPPSMPVRLYALAPIAIAVASFAAIALVHWGSYRTRRRYILLFGLGAWLVAACLYPEGVVLALTGVAAMLTLSGLGPIVSDLGRRSRTYRQKVASQQAIGPLTAAIGVGVLSLVGADLFLPLIGTEAASQLRVVASVSLLMTAVGFLYLLLNAIWIWRALWGWQPLLQRVLDRETTPAPEA